MDPSEAVRPLLRVHQVRAFTEEPVDPAAIDAIADAARWSGSAGNAQPWRFVIVRRSDVLRQLAEAGLPSTKSLATAAAAIAIVMPQEKGSAVSHAYDEGRAAERTLIAAFMLGLGAAIAWFPSEARPRAAELLGLPEGRFVRTVVAIGHPTAKAERPKSRHGEARLPRSETVLEGRWMD